MNEIVDSPDVNDFACDRNIIVSFYRTQDFKTYGATVFRNTKTVKFFHWSCVAKKTGKTETPIESTLLEVQQWAKESVKKCESVEFLFDQHVPNGKKQAYPVIDSPLPQITIYTHHFADYRQNPIEKQIRDLRDNTSLSDLVSISDEMVLKANPFHDDSDRNLLDEPKSDLPTEFPITQAFLIFAAYLRTCKS
jgi:hypothetical protein